MSAILARGDTVPDLAPASSGAAASPSGQTARDGSGAFVVRLLSPLHLGDNAGDIAALAERALTRNLFYEGGFLVHAAHHLRDAGRPHIAAIWRDGTLVGLFPLVTPRFGFGAPRARGWLSHYMTDGAPLIDAACAADVLRALLRWLGEGERPVAGIVFPSLDADGPFAALARGVATRDGLALASFNPRVRAILKPGEGDAASGLSGGRRKELARLARRFAEEGVVTTRSATTRAEVRDAFEHFLALETRGWKGRARTAMMQDPAAAAFARSMTRALAGEGRCRIDFIELDGRPIAATIELTAGERASFWKIAYDEEHSRFSPGVQAALNLTRRHVTGSAVALVDSCAEANHPMIDHLWSDRMNVVDLFVGATPGKTRAANRIIRREKIRRGSRAVAKRVYRALRPLKII